MSDEDDEYSGELERAFTIVANNQLCDFIANTMHEFTCIFITFVVLVLVLILSTIGDSFHTVQCRYFPILVSSCPVKKVTLSY